MSAPSLPPNVQPFCLPPGLSLDEILVLPVTYLMISATLTALMYPLLLALFLFSTPALRRSALFWLNVASVLLGIAQGNYNARNDIRTILNPIVPEATETFIASAVLLAAGPIFVDSILLVRLLAVYPYRATPRLKWLVLISIPIAGAIFRIVNVAIFSHRIQASVSGDPALEGANIIQKFDNIKIEWIAQLLMNAYMSGMFLWKMYGHHLNMRSLRSASSSSTGGGNPSFSERLVELMWIAVFNFVPPVLLNIAQLVVSYVAADFTTATYISQANFHVAIIGVAAATVWVSGSRWAEEHQQRPSAGTGGALSTMNFASPAQMRSENVSVGRKMRFARRGSVSEFDEPVELGESTARSESFTSAAPKASRLGSDVDLEAKPEARY